MFLCEFMTCAPTDDTRVIYSAHWQMKGVGHASLALPPILVQFLPFLNSFQQTFCQIIGFAPISGNRTSPLGIPGLSQVQTVDNGVSLTSRTVFHETLYSRRYSQNMYFWENISFSQRSKYFRAFV